MIRMFSVVVLVSAAACLAEPPGKITVTGNLITEGLTGRTATPHGWTVERAFALPLDKGDGMGVETLREPPGRFQMPGDLAEFPGFTPGRYVLFTLGYDQIPAYGLLKDVRLPVDPAQKTPFDLKTPVQYSVIFNKGAEEWDAHPYVGGTDMYQTFVATSPHITRIATKLADKAGDHVPLTLNYGIYEPNDGPPSTWKLISPVRSRTYGSGVDPIIHIYHVSFRSNEITLKPGKTYAVRFWRDPSSVSESFSIVARPDKKDGYRGGQMYNGDKPLPEWDVYAYISGGEPGTIVNHAPVGDLDLKKFAGGAQKFGQTFKATGKGLAGVDVIYATGKLRPVSYPVTFQLYDQPGGSPIGPARTCYGVPLVYQARAAAVWMPDEAPMTPGRTYYIEWTLPTSVNTWVLNEELPGEAYRDGQALPDADLAMSIVEYEAPGTTTQRVGEKPKR